MRGNLLQTCVICPLYKFLVDFLAIFQTATTTFSASSTTVLGLPTTDKKTIVIVWFVLFGVIK